jgi:methylmalonyl-CoA/ethylmalonyl-CoA epimerase
MPGMTNSVPDDAHTGLPAELFSTIDHVGIAVPDLDEALAFYARTFGISSVHEETNAEQGVREAMLAVGDGTTRIQLLAPLTPDSTIARFIDRSGPGLQQLAYRVTSIEAAMDAVRSTGMRLLYDAPRRGTAGSRINFIHPKDAGGVLVELVEPQAPAADAGTPAADTTPEG